jgi:hypothetical protein
MALSELSSWMANPQYLNRVRFGITRNPNLAIIVPCWLLTATSAALSILPWLPWIRCKFSLRTLLIATTLAAVGLGLIVAASR